MDDDEVIVLAIFAAFMAVALLSTLAGYGVGREEQRAIDHAEIVELYDRIAVLEHQRHVHLVGPRILFEDIEPGTYEDLLNRADPGCELCEGAGHVGPAPCPCTEVLSSPGRSE